MIIQEDFTHDLWGAVSLGLRDGVPGGLILPDTVTAFDVADIDFDRPISFGTFFTHEPERFSCLVEGRIATKESLAPAVAWGRGGMDRPGGHGQRC